MSKVLLGEVKHQLSVTYIVQFIFFGAILVLFMQSVL